LMRLAMEYDKYPLLKVYYTEKEIKYIPTKSFSQEIRRAFRSNLNFRESSLVVGFKAYQHLNTLDQEAHDRLPWYNRFTSSAVQRKNAQEHSDTELIPSLTSDIKPGNILVSHPTLSHIFYQTVIIILKHDNEETLGCVLDRRDSREPAYWDGGPVPVRDFLLLHTNAIANGKAITNELYYTYLKDMDVLHKIKPSEFRLFSSVCRWIPGQLHMELEKGTWFLVECPQQILFQPRKNAKPATNPLITITSISDRPTISSKTIHSKTTSNEPTTVQGQEVGGRSLTTTATTAITAITTQKVAVFDFGDGKKSTSAALWKKVLRLMGGEYTIFSYIDEPEGGLL